MQPVVIQHLLRSCADFAEGSDDKLLILAMDVTDPAVGRSVRPRPPQPSTNP